MWVPAGAGAWLGTTLLSRWQKSALPSSTWLRDREEATARPSLHPRRCHLSCFWQSWHLSSLTCFSLSCGRQETAPGEEHAAGKPSSAS